MKSVSIVFIEVKKSLSSGIARLDVIAQVLAESAGMCRFHFVTTSDLMTLLIILACDYANSKGQHWVPILAIVCDGEKFEFLVYDSVIKSVYSSGVVTGVVDQKKKSHLLVPTLKESKVMDNLPPTFRC
jgi:hypothetical protein